MDWQKSAEAVGVEVTIHKGLNLSARQDGGVGWVAIVTPDLIRGKQSYGIATSPASSAESSQ